MINFFGAANKQGNASALLQQRFHLSAQQFVNNWSRWTFTQLR